MSSQTRRRRAPAIVLTPTQKRILLGASEYPLYSRKAASQSGKLRAGTPRLLAGLDADRDHKWIWIRHFNTREGAKGLDCLRLEVGWKLAREGVVNLEEDLDVGSLVVDATPSCVDDSAHNRLRLPCKGIWQVEAVELIPAVAKDVLYVALCVACKESAIMPPFNAGMGTEPSALHLFRVVDGQAAVLGHRTRSPAVVGAMHPYLR